MEAPPPQGSLREGAGAGAPEGERETVEVLKGGEIYIVVTPTVGWLVFKTKTNFKVARAPPAAHAPPPLPEGGFWT